MEFQDTGKMPVLRGGGFAMLEDPLRFLHIIEVAFFLADDLIILVPLAREEDNVPLLGVGQNPLDGPAAVHFDYRAFSDARRSAVLRCYFSTGARQLYIGRQPRNYFIENGLWRFG